MGWGGVRSHYDDPAYYWYAYQRRRADVRYYQGLIDGSPRVLEYGVGNGRVALAVARRGAHVTGVDTSARMLDDLRARLERQPKRIRTSIELRRGDMRHLKLSGRFDWVLAPFNTVQHLYDARDFERFLSRVKAHLAPGGSLVFDFSVPRPWDLSNPTGRRARAHTFRYPGGARVRYTEQFHYDPIRQLLHTTMHFEPVANGRPFRTLLTQRQWFPREVEALLHYNGFSQIRFLADFDPLASFEEVDTVAVTTRLGPG